MSDNIACFIKTCNSQETLCRCLESLKDFKEIVIIDEHSSDDTFEIAKMYKAKIIFADKNNLSLGYNQAKQETSADWILVLDDNEAINKNLADEIQKSILKKSKKNAIAFYINKKTMFFNKELNAAKNKEIRLFKKDNVDFKGDYFIEFDLIKEKKSKIYSIKLNSASIYSYLKNDVEKEFEEFFEKKRFLTKTLFLNSKSIRPSVFIKPLKTFFYLYIIKKACFEGKFGFIYSQIEAIKSFLFEIMLIEKKFEEENDF